LIDANHDVGEKIETEMLSPRSFLSADKRVPIFPNFSTKCTAMCAYYNNLVVIAHRTAKCNRVRKTGVLLCSILCLLLRTTHLQKAPDFIENQELFEDFWV